MDKEKVKIKKGKKGFYEVEAPLTSAKISLYAQSKEELEGKIIKLDLTKTLRGKSLELKMRIVNSEENLQGKPEAITLSGSYIRKIMRKGTDYVEDSFETECKDSLIRIKPFLITRKRVSRTILKVLREEGKKYLQSYIKTRSSQELFTDIISNKIQKQLSIHLKKIYPLALCEIRVFEVISKKESVKKQKDSSDK